MSNNNKENNERINFFDISHQTPLHHEKFGICDSSSGKCYASIEKKDPCDWGATVINEEKKEIIFTPIDQGVLSNPLLYAGKKCDAMLTSDKILYLIELKARKRPGTANSEGRKQLLSTIELLKNHHADIDERYTNKKAFVCNKKLHAVKSAHHSTILEFRKLNFELIYSSVIYFK